MTAIENEFLYTATAIENGKTSDIESYKTLEAAIFDILEMWLEGPCDVRISGPEGKLYAYMAPDPADASVCHLHYLQPPHPGRLRDRCETWKCTYLLDGEGNYLETALVRLDTPE